MSEVRGQVAMPPRPSWAWQDAAACRGKDIVLFFGPDGERQPERENRERKAKAVCASCPVQAECLNYAVSRPEKYGTWGGLNEGERASERRRRMRRANAAEGRPNRRLLGAAPVTWNPMPEWAYDLLRLPGCASRRVPGR